MKAVRFIAPTQNVDNTSISYTVNYELGIVQPDGTIAASGTTIAGEADGSGYTFAAIDDEALGLTPGSYQIAVRAINAESGAASEWSTPVTYVVPNEIPKAPSSVSLADAPAA